MTDEQIDLAHRLVAREEFHARIYCPIDSPSQRERTAVDGIQWIAVDGAWLPDLTDKATGGVLLGMLGPCWSACRGERGWTVYDTKPGEQLGGQWATVLRTGRTLAEAAGRALLACWEGA